MGVELLVDEQHWCTRMVEIGAGPKNSFLFVDSFISNAVIIGNSAPGGNAKLLKNVGWILERKIPAATKPMRDINNDVGILARLAGRIDALLPVNYTAFRAAPKPVFFFMQTAGEDYVGVMRGLGHEEVDHSEVLQVRQRFAREVGVWQRNKRVEAHR